MTLSQQNLKSTTEQTGATLFHRPPTPRPAPRFLTAVYTSNLALTPEHGFRLLRDLTERFRTSKLLEEFDPQKEVGKETLIQIMKSQDKENTNE